jgi:trigger factor
MQVTETLSDGLKRGFTIVVPGSEIEGKRTARLSELGRTVNLPGFRPGKVPPTVIRQRYGSAVRAEVLEESVTEATRQALADRGLRPALQPKVDVVEAAAGTTDLEFKVEVELMPEIAVPDLAVLSLTRLKAKPADEAIDKTVAELFRRRRETILVDEDRGAETGELLTVDYVGRVDGKAFQGGTATGQMVEVGGEGFIPGFSEGLAGLKPGETRTIATTFPETFPDKALAGKQAAFEVTARALRRPTEAPIDDAFAEKVGFDSLADLRQAIGGQMQREYDQLSRLRIKRELLDALAARAEFPIPEGMVQAEFDQIWARVQQEREAGQPDAEDKDKDEPTLRAEYRAIAGRRVRLGLLLAEIGRVNGITVAPDEMTRAMRAEAGRYPGREAQIMEFFRKNPQATDGLRGPIFEEKVVDFILELAQVTDREVSPEELSVEPEAAAAAPPSDQEPGEAAGTPPA